MPGLNEEIIDEKDGQFLVRGTTHLRDINRQLQWQLPLDGAKTINGLILEYLEEIPQSATCFKIGRYVIEIVQVRDTAVHTARIKALAED